MSTEQPPPRPNPFDMAGNPARWLRKPAQADEVAADDDEPTEPTEDTPAPLNGHSGPYEYTLRGNQIAVVGAIGQDVWALPDSLGNFGPDHALTVATTDGVAWILSLDDVPSDCGDVQVNDRVTLKAPGSTLTVNRAHVDHGRFVPPDELDSDEVQSAVKEAPPTARFLLEGRSIYDAVRLAREATPKPVPESPAVKHPLEVDWSRAISGEPAPAPDWIVWPFIARGRTIVPYGDPGSLKTTLTLVMCMRAACGLPILEGEEARPPVKIVYGLHELGQDQLIDDVLSVAIVEGMDLDLLSANFRVLDLHHDQFGGGIHTEYGAAELLAYLEDEGVDGFVLDSIGSVLSSASPSSNDALTPSGPMRRFATDVLRPIKDLGIGTAFIGHGSKSDSKNLLGSIQGPGSVDALIHFSADPPKERVTEIGERLVIGRVRLETQMMGLRMSAMPSVVELAAVSFFPAVWKQVTPRELPSSSGTPASGSTNQWIGKMQALSKDRRENVLIHGEAVLKQRENGVPVTSVKSWRGNSERKRSVGPFNQNDWSLIRDYANGRMAGTFRRLELADLDGEVGPLDLRPPADSLPTVDGSSLD